MKPLDYNYLIKLLAAYITDIGVPREYAISTAYGIVDQIRRHCWDNFSDVFDDVKSITLATDFPQPAKLVKILIDLGIINHGADGTLYYPFALSEAPDKIRKQWARTSPVSYGMAKKRKVARKKPKARRPRERPERPQPEPQVNSESSERDLFGDIITTNETSQDKGHHSLVKYFCESWEQTHGIKYPFTRQDAANIKQLFTASGSLERAKEIITGYLGCRDQWYTGKGHKLSLLVSDLPKFLAKETANQIKYQGYGDSIIINADDRVGQERGNKALG